MPKSMKVAIAAAALNVFVVTHSQADNPLPLPANPTATASISVEPQSAALNTLTAREKAEGWKLLFDGKTMNGWTNYRKDTVSDGWKVIDGAMVMSRKGSGDITTVDEYGAFELSLEYKISPAGNSGLMYHVKPTASTPWQTGPEVQIQDNVDGHDPQKSGWLYQLYPSEVDATKPAGQWNQLRIVITPTKCEHYMNGVKYCEYVKGSDDWKAKVAASKFKAFEGFGEPTSGYIALQDHNDEVAFRNVKIRVLE